MQYVKFRSEEKYFTKSLSTLTNLIKFQVHRVTIASICKRGRGHARFVQASSTLVTLLVFWDRLKTMANPDLEVRYWRPVQCLIVYRSAIPDRYICNTEHNFTMLYN